VPPKDLVLVFGIIHQQTCGMHQSQACKGVLYGNMVVVFHCFIDEFGGYLQLYEQFDALCVEGSNDSCCNGYEWVY